VAIVGDGAVGLIALQVARAQGAGTVILLGHRAARLALGQALGATASIDTRDPAWHQALLDQTDGLGAQGVIEAGGSPGAVNDAIRASRKGGRIVLLTVAAKPVPIDTWALVEGERTLVGSVQHHLHDDLPAAVDLVAQGLVRVAPLITRRIPLDRVVEKGFATPDRNDIKVLVSTG
jgi:threonine dehydrogenase-like Zn-dependent dehydrogenase